MNTMSDIVTNVKESNDVSRLGKDSNGKRWEDYDYIRVPNKKGNMVAKDHKDDYGTHDLPDGTRYTVIDMEKLLDDQNRAKTALVHLVPFFGAFTSKLRPVYTFHVDTQATDGYNLLINPLFTYNLNIEEKVFVLAHEIMHCVLNHMRRAKARHDDHEKSNIAADYECNVTLADGFKIVSQGILKGIDALYNKNYLGWGYEKIYDSNPSGQPSNPQKGEGADPQKSDSGSGSGSGSQKQQFSSDFKAGWNQAMEDYKNGKLKI